MRARSEEAYHVSLSRRRSPVRIRSGPPMKMAHAERYGSFSFDVFRPDLIRKRFDVCTISANLCRTQEILSSKEKISWREAIIRSSPPKQKTQAEKLGSFALGRLVCDANRAEGMVRWSKISRRSLLRERFCGEGRNPLSGRARHKREYPLSA